MNFIREVSFSHILYQDLMLHLPSTCPPVTSDIGPVGSDDVEPDQRIHLNLLLSDEHSQDALNLHIFGFSKSQGGPTRNKIY